MKKYLFDKPLRESFIKSRPNRFVMQVVVNGKIVRCFCPCSTRIGSLKFENIPCLLSANKNNGTQYTVEAISLNPLSAKRRSWIGINQTKINSYREHFFRNRQLNRILSKITSVKREYPLSRTRIDLLVDSTLIEIKTPLTSLSYKNKLSRDAAFNSYHRTVKHYKVLFNNVGNLKRAIVLHCFMYDANIYKDILSNIKNQRMRNIIIRATNSGVENWQVNLKIDVKGVRLNLKKA